MMDNHSYNLMRQLTEEHTSLWRIKDEYLKDSGDCTECKVLWEKLATDKEAHTTELIALIKKHLE